MTVRPSILNVISIGTMAFVGVWLIDRALIAAGAGNISIKGDTTSA